MKFTTIMYLHVNVNGKALRAKSSVFWRNVYEFLDYIKNRLICITLRCITGKVFVQVPWETNQNDCYSNF